MSFELLDINIVQELEKFPFSNPAGKESATTLTISQRKKLNHKFAFCPNWRFDPCVSPVSHDAPAQERNIDSPAKEDNEVTGVRNLFGKILCVYSVHNSLHLAMI